MIADENATYQAAALHDAPDDVTISVSEQTTVSGSIPDGTALITSDIDITISGPATHDSLVYDHPAE